MSAWSPEPKLVRVGASLCCCCYLMGAGCCPSDRTRSREQRGVRSERPLCSLWWGTRCSTLCWVCVQGAVERGQQHPWPEVSRCCHHGCAVRGAAAPLLRAGGAWGWVGGEGTDHELEPPAALGASPPGQPGAPCLLGRLQMVNHQRTQANRLPGSRHESMAGGRRSSKGPAAPSGHRLRPGRAGGCTTLAPGWPLCSWVCPGSRLVEGMAPAPAWGVEQVCDPARAGSLPRGAAPPGTAVVLAAVVEMGVWTGTPLLPPGARGWTQLPGFPCAVGAVTPEPLCPSPCPLAPRPRMAPAPLPSGPPLRAALLWQHHPPCRSISSLIYFCCSAAWLFSLLLRRLWVSSARGR